MNNRERYLYLLVPLLWVIFIGAAVGAAYVRHAPPGSDEAGEHGHSLMPTPDHQTVAQLPVVTRQQEARPWLAYPQGP